MILDVTKVTCPKCKQHVATVNCDVELEEDGSLAIQDFDWKMFKVVKGNMIAGHCPKCGENWTDTGGCAHAEGGWQEMNKEE